jgi:hypothetical protein
MKNAATGSAISVIEADPEIRNAHGSLHLFIM